MYKNISIALLVLALLLSGCSAANRGLDSTGMVPPAEAPSVAPDIQREALGEGYAYDKGNFSVDNSATSVERLVVKNATLSISVADPQKSMDTVSKMAEAMGGFVVSANMIQQTLENGAKVPQVSMTIRVPVERLDEAMASIKAETDQPIISENVNSQDVTAEYTDLQSRLTNLEAAERQLQEIMGSANRTEDVLAVYAQLVSVREQIEVIKGQIKYYEQSAALSSISIQMYANAATQPITIAGWQPKGVAKEALQSLIRTLQSLGSFGIRTVILYIPVLIIIFAPILLIIWGISALVKRNRRGRKTPLTTPEA